MNSQKIYMQDIQSTQIYTNLLSGLYEYIYLFTF